MKKNSKKGRNLSIESIAGSMLLSLGDAIDVFPILMMYGGAKKFEYYGFDLNDMREDTKRKSKLEALYRLKKQKYLTYKKGSL